jgi:hypothetical protein
MRQLQEENDRVYAEFLQNEEQIILQHSTEMSNRLEEQKQQLADESKKVKQKQQDDEYEQAKQMEIIARQELSAFESMQKTHQDHFDGVLYRHHRQMHPNIGRVKFPPFARVRCCVCDSVGMGVMCTSDDRHVHCLDCLTSSANVHVSEMEASPMFPLAYDQFSPCQMCRPGTTVNLSPTVGFFNRMDFYTMYTQPNVSGEKCRLAQDVYRRWLKREKEVTQERMKKSIVLKLAADAAKVKLTELEGKRGGGQDEMLAQSITIFTGEVLTNKCPHCEAAYLDFTACCLLTCNNLHCQGDFCAWCEVAFNKAMTSAEKHSHVSDCGRVFLLKLKTLGNESKHARVLQEGIPRWNKLIETQLEGGASWYCNTEAFKVFILWRNVERAIKWLGSVPSTQVQVLGDFVNTHLPGFSVTSLSQRKFILVE